MFEQIKQALEESTMRVVTGLAHVLPGLAALLVAVLISILAAMAVRTLLRRFLRGIDFDSRMSKWGWSGVSELSPDGSPTLLVAQFVHWSVILFGISIGVAALDAAVTEQMVMRLVVYLPNVLAALLLLVFGNVIARFLAQGVLIGAVNANLPYGRLLSLGVKWLVIVLTTAMALNHLGIGGRIVELAFGILFGGIVLALALAVGLGSKDLVSRSLEKRTSEPAKEAEESFRHF